MTHMIERAPFYRANPSRRSGEDTCGERTSLLATADGEVAGERAQSPTLRASHPRDGRAASGARVGALTRLY
jgi:hypothetical protein